MSHSINSGAIPIFISLTSVTDPDNKTLVIDANLIAALWADSLSTTGTGITLRPDLTKLFAHVSESPSEILHLISAQRRVIAYELKIEEPAQ